MYAPLTARLPPPPRLLQLVIACIVDLFLPAGEHVGRRHESNGAVQPCGVVVVYGELNQSPPILGRHRSARPNTFAFQVVGDDSRPRPADAAPATLAELSRCRPPSCPLAGP